MPSETKHSLLQICEEGRPEFSPSLRDTFEPEFILYEKEGTKYLHRFIPENRGKNPRAN